MAHFQVQWQCSTMKRSQVFNVTNASDHMQGLCFLRLWISEFWMERGRKKLNGGHIYKNGTYVMHQIGGRELPCKTVGKGERTAN
jgi:hypothetical protein